MNSTTKLEVVAEQEEALQRLVGRLIQEITITHDDLAKLTPGQKKQAQMMASYSKKVAQRYIVNIIRPKELREINAQVEQKKPVKKKTKPIKKTDRSQAKLAVKIQKKGFVEKDTHNSSLFLDSLKHRDIALSRCLRPLTLLNRIKQPVPVYRWEDREFLTTEQVANYYGVADYTVERILSRNREEIEREGLAALEKQLTAWSPRAVVRIGLLLHESSTAIHLRKVLAEGCRI